MAFINDHFLEIEENYFSETILKKANEFSLKYPEKKIIYLDGNHSNFSLVPTTFYAMHSNTDNQNLEEATHSLHYAIKNYYLDKGVSLGNDEIFIGHGSKSDLSNISDIFSKDNVFLIPNPVYPTFTDTTIMSGGHIIYLDCNKENYFLPMPPTDEISPDIIYLCSPNNPNGAVYTKAELQEWVDYANSTSAIILFDATYSPFIQDISLPKSIFEIENAKTCAIEFCNFSNASGSSDLVCSYTLIPKDVVAYSLEDEPFSVNKLWARRQDTKSNAVSPIIQKAAATVLTQKGQQETKNNIAYYMENIQIIINTMKSQGLPYVGGEHSPFIWVKCPNHMSSWDFFDYVLNETAIVVMPGIVFGENGQGYFQISSLADKKDVLEAMERFKALEFK